MLFEANFAFTVTRPTVGSTWPAGSTQDLGFTFSAPVDVSELDCSVINAVAGGWYGAQATSAADGHGWPGLHAEPLDQGHPGRHPHGHRVPSPRRRRAGQLASQRLWRLLCGNHTPSLYWPTPISYGGLGSIRATVPASDLGEDRAGLFLGAFCGAREIPGVDVRTGRRHIACILRIGLMTVRRTQRG